MAEKNPRVRLMVDFHNPEQLAAFVSACKVHEVIPDNVGAYECESLDFNSGSGITRKYTYILRQIGQRPEQTRLRLVTVRKEEV